MASLSPWALSDPAWLRVAWVASLVLGSLGVWALFLLCSLRGRQPPSLWTGQQLGGSKSQTTSEKRRKKSAKGKLPPSQRKEQAAPSGPDSAPLAATKQQEVMSSSRRKEKPKMAEESSSGSSGGSPSPGDTLPWNLPKHQRTKRTKASSGNGTVLDPAERAVIRIAGREG
ncbi:Hypothetical predicted protein [Podarcis lilfordi]|uniref:Uncharacterized protein n=1 Tax=Podarcis lilfordi TaxID=74358 RepID=A0AA35PB30_9SAUR|nr:Hypothetical predicted protein [Podarcis lilfordi]